MEHSSTDEPASDLSKRIAAEKARLVRAGEFREPRNAIEINRDGLSFVPAAHWAWCRLIEIARPSYGFAFKSSQFNVDKRGMPLIRIRDISKTDTEAYYEGDYDHTYLVRAGDYLVAMDGDFNLRRWQGPEGLLNQRVMCINGWRCDIDPEFVKLPLQMVLDYLHRDTSLTTVKHLSAKQVNGIEIPLPPLAEQRRIVAKVNELTALCDQLEAARADREATRDRLAAASLVRLDAPDPDPAIFRVHAAFALENIAPLTTRLDQIKDLRQTILNLAVRGKPVEQDPKDEPASVLLKRWADKKSKNRKGRDWSQGVKPTDSLAFEAPSGWEWTTIDQAAHRVTVGHVGQMKDEYVEEGIPFLRSQNVRPNAFRPDGLTFISPEFHRKIIKSALAPGDIVVVRSGNVGTACAIPEDLPVANCSDLVVIQKPEVVVADYLCFYLNSLASVHVEAGTAGVALTHFNTKSVATMPLPLSPLAEQHRIVAKVDELMALCDRLEVALTAADTTRQRLLEALLHEALAPASTPI